MAGDINCNDSIYSTTAIELGDKDYYKIWNYSQVERLKELYECKYGSGKYQGDIGDEHNNALLEVIHTIENNIKVLCEHYSDIRDVDADLGGWLAFFPKTITEQNMSYKELLNQYHIKSSELAEVNEVISSVEGKMEYVQQIFLCSSDYALIIIFPRLVEGVED